MLSRRRVTEGVTPCVRLFAACVSYDPRCKEKEVTGALCRAQVLEAPGLLTPAHSTRLTLGGAGGKAQSACCG